MLNSDHLLNEMPSFMHLMALNSATPNEIPTVDDVVIRLASDCNYAFSRDGVGFNAADATIGHTINETILACQRIPDEWRPQALKFLETYKGQIEKLFSQHAYALVVSSPRFNEDPENDRAEVVVTASMYGTGLRLPIPAFRENAVRSEAHDELKQHIISQSDLFYWSNIQSIDVSVDTIKLPAELETLMRFLSMVGYRLDQSAEAVLKENCERLGVEFDPRDAVSQFRPH